MALLSFGADSGGNTNVVELLRKDHEKVKMLFREFESTEDAEEKLNIVQRAISELEVHALAEEKIFYPAVRKDSPDAGPNLDESFEEHHVMKFLIGELKTMSPEDARFDAKFTVLTENVKHHIKEEEAELFARARTGRLDLAELGKKLTAAKASIHANSKKKKSKATPERKHAKGRSALKRQTVRKSKKHTAA
ncbi:MAG: hemerythrin domain-containing protein [Nitrospirota bacterium]|nr:hemerythrin domain-containing protein [Nitrospirota bacterium]